MTQQNKLSFASEGLSNSSDVFKRNTPVTNYSCEGTGLKDELQKTSNKMAATSQPDGTANIQGTGNPETQKKQLPGTKKKKKRKRAIGSQEGTTGDNDPSLDGTNKKGPEILKVALVPAGYPSTTLTVEQVEEISKMLIERLSQLNVEDGIQPRFTRIRQTMGGCLLCCKDKETKEWAKSIANDLVLSDGVKLNIATSFQLKGCIRGRAFFPGPPMNEEKLMRRLRLQNRTLFLDRWVVLQKKAKIGGGTLVWFKIPDIAIKPLKVSKLQLCFNLATVKVYVVNKKKLNQKANNESELLVEPSNERPEVPNKKRKMENEYNQGLPRNQRPREDQEKVRWAMNEKGPFHHEPSVVEYPRKEKWNDECGEGRGRWGNERGQPRFRPVERWDEDWKRSRMEDERNQELSRPTAGGPSMKHRWDDDWQGRKEPEKVQVPPRPMEGQDGGWRKMKNNRDWAMPEDCPSKGSRNEGWEGRRTENDRDRTPPRSMAPVYPMRERWDENWDDRRIENERDRGPPRSAALHFPLREGGAGKDRDGRGMEIERERTFSSMEENPRKERWKEDRERRGRIDRDRDPPPIRAKEKTFREDWQDRRRIRSEGDKSRELPREEMKREDRGRIERERWRNDDYERRIEKEPAVSKLTEYPVRETLREDWKERRLGNDMGQLPSTSREEIPKEEWRDNWDARGRMENKVSMAPSQSKTADYPIKERWSDDWGHRRMGNEWEPMPPKPQFEVPRTEEWRRVKGNELSQKSSGLQLGREVPVRQSWGDDWGDKRTMKKDREVVPTIPAIGNYSGQVNWNGGERSMMPTSLAGPMAVSGRSNAGTTTWGSDWRTTATPFSLASLGDRRPNFTFPTTSGQNSGSQIAGGHPHSMDMSFGHFGGSVGMQRHQ